MKESLFLRDLIIGSHRFIESWSLYKRIMLTGNMTFLGALLGLVFLVFEILNGRYFYITVDSSLVVGSVFVLILLRQGFYTAGRLAFLLIALIIASYFFMVEPIQGGTFSFFFVVAVASLTIFGFERINLGVSFLVFTLLTALFIYIFDIHLFDIPNYTDDYIWLSFIFDFIISSGMILFMIYTIMAINYRSIKNIQKRDVELNNKAKQLSESRSRFELAVQGSRTGIWDWDVRKDSIYISPLLNEITGYKTNVNQISSIESLFRTIHPDDQEYVRSALDSHLYERKEFQTEFRFLKADKSYIWVMDTGQAEWDENGSPVRMVGSLVDISERKNSEKMNQEQNEMLEKTNKELDRFVYSVSHDLKSPLSSVLGLMSITEMTEDIGEIRKCLEMMRNRINALNGFIEEIINYSRNSRTQTNTTDIVHPHALVLSIIENLQFLEKMDKIRIHINIDPELKVLTDNSRLKIILNNLIGNAIKYHDESLDEPFIIITADVKHPLLEVIVEDNGYGIHQDMHEKVFEMFYRATEQSQGSGLGLYIAKEMASKLEGTLELESNIGEGAKFILNIPVNINSIESINV